MQDNYNPEIHKNIKEEPIPCHKCANKNYFTLQYKTLNEPLKGDVTARYCSKCQSIYPLDAKNAKRAFERIYLKKWKRAA